MKPDHAALTTKIFAVLGSVALGFCAMMNAVIAAVALFTGNLFGALGDARLDESLTASANHTATSAKALAIGFGLVAALEFGAGEFLRRRVRHAVVAVACGATVAGAVGFSIWVGRFTALDAMLVGCALFAAWTWWRLPRGERLGDAVPAELSY
jgi:hypothetical protein